MPPAIKAARVTPPLLRSGQNNGRVGGGGERRAMQAPGFGSGTARNPNGGGAPRGRQLGGLGTGNTGFGGRR